MILDRRWAAILPIAEMLTKKIDLKKGEKGSFLDFRGYLAPTWEE